MTSENTGMMTSHIDRFVIENSPSVEDQPDFIFDESWCELSEKLNIAEILVDRWVNSGAGERIAIRTDKEQWTYEKLQQTANQIANVLVNDYGLIPGNRVLLHSPNNPMMVAAWIAIVKAGGVVVTVMPLLKGRDIEPVIEKAQITHAISDFRLVEEVRKASRARPVLQNIIVFNGSGDPLNDQEFDDDIKSRPTWFSNIDTYVTDPVLLGFTSGTTGVPKATIHYHRDVILMSRSFVDNILHPKPSDRFIGSPPIGFTFGLGALVTFPFYIGASSVLVEAGSPANLAQAIENHKATICFTAPTAYRAILNLEDKADLSSLNYCVSAGEHLPLSVFEEWKRQTGVEMMNLLGATEMFHSFICMRPDNVVPGAVGLVAPGYEARIVDENLENVPNNQEGLLAVRGITGCRYLNDPRQTSYVRSGWNITGDIFKKDDAGFYWFIARGDEMIISSGYNISGVEVEAALLEHPAIAEVGVAGIPDPSRGSLVTAFIVLNDGYDGSDELVDDLKTFVKSTIAPFKYPRKIEFISALPKTATGKIQRKKLPALLLK